MILSIVDSRFSLSLKYSNSLRVSAVGFLVGFKFMRFWGGVFLVGFRFMRFWGFSAHGLGCDI